MAVPNFSSWTFRPALPDEAAEACLVIRQSIEVLCAADHEGDRAILDQWLANKTPEQVRGWIETNAAGVLVGIGLDGIGGVGAVVPDGTIVLNYVAPWARFCGVSKGMMRALECRAADWGQAFCSLTSTITAHPFYRAYGYLDVGAPVASFGGKPAFPMRRAIR